MIQLGHQLGKLAALFLVVGIVLSPLRAVAATIPMTITYDAAVGPTGTVRVETGPSLPAVEGEPHRVSPRAQV